MDATQSPVTIATTPDESGTTVRLAACGCGVLAGEVCDCAQFAAGAAAVFRNPIFWDLRVRKADV